MYLIKNVVPFLFIAAILFAACDTNQTNEDANNDIVSDTSALSTDLVNNPSTMVDGKVSLEQTGLLVFEDTVHDFGNVTEGEIIQHEFEYVNKGSKEVIIINAKGSCGCTVPEYDSKPIPPGGKGSMKVTFDSKGRTGYNEKNVQVTTNGVPSKYRLTILSKVQ